ncbi:MAG: peptide deformylase [Lentisphaeria bacterium]|nr:peptide deformylase [Lentisphaeria bacterium]
MAESKNYSVKIYGHDVLKQVAEPVSTIDAEIIQLASDMTVMMDKYDGIGLAAPQIGVSKRIVILGVPDSPESRTGTPGEELLLPMMPMAIINPEITAVSDATIKCDEGCLSVPDIFGPVERPARVVLRATLLDGSTIECECGGLLARCIQHELDHLDGYCFVDRMTDAARNNVGFKLFRLEKYGKKHNFERPCKK